MLSVAGYQYPVILPSEFPQNSFPTVLPQSLSPSSLYLQPYIPHSNKRGSDELMSHTPMVTNGESHSNMDAKKLKMETNYTPSRVIHFRNIPQDTTESEIIQMGLPFGKMTNLVLAKKKSQALLEMADIKTATEMVNYYNENNKKPQIRGRTIYIQYSNHEELKTEDSSQNAGAQAALQAAQQLMGSMEEPKNVLRVIIEHMLYPVAIDVLKQIFSRFGSVLRIVTFNKNDTFQALIEYSDPIAAQTAKLSINGQNIYNGCCTLRIDFSKLTTLNVKYNNDKSKDYTNPNLPAGDSNMTLEALGSLGFGSAPGVFASPFALPGLGSPLTAYGQPSGPDGLPMHQGNYHMHHFNGLGLTQQQAAAMQASMGLRLPGHLASGPVLLVSNLNEQEATPDALFTLFGLYGDVHRVKILYNKKDNALIQFADASQAQTAMTHLDKVKSWGKQLKVVPSKNVIVQMPKEGQPDNGLTKDFSNSPLHRFKTPNSKNHHNIFPPSATLHLSNIPECVLDDDLKELFKGYGSVLAFKFFQKDRKMALIQLGSVDEAIDALVNLHNYDLGEKHHLRVSFTKSVI